MLQPGANALGVMLGNGMYNVEGVEDRYKKFVGTFGQLRLIAQLAITYEDGSREIVGSDDQWRTRPGPIVFSSLFGGEDHAARLEIAAWDRRACRSEERRVGQECVSTFRSRWSPYPSNNTSITDQTSTQYRYSSNETIL